MAERSRISWLTGPDGKPGATWNPVSGCTPVSEGCEHCYAARMVGRGLPHLHGTLTMDGSVGGEPTVEHLPFSTVLTHEERLHQPLTWRRPRRIFVCSMGDLFNNQVPDEFIDLVFATMAQAPQHQFIALTKRQERMLEYVREARNLRTIMPPHVSTDGSLRTWPLPNVILGVTVENQEAANERIPILLETPAAQRWISVEPMLGPVDLGWLNYDHGVTSIDALRGTHGVAYPHRGECSRLDWVVCGAETGPGARPMNPEWARALQAQCADAEVPFYLKQMSNRQPIPPDLLTRQWPKW
jgi:protein gp37